MLRAREVRFRDLGIESMRDFRARKAHLATLPPEVAAQDPLSQDKFGDLFLVIDGWASIRSDFEILEPTLEFTCGSGSFVWGAPGDLRVALDGDPRGRQGHARHPHRTETR